MKRNSLVVLSLLLPLSALVTVPVHAQSTVPATRPADGDAIAVRRGDVSTLIEIDGYFEALESYEVRVRPEAYQGDLKVVSAAAPGTRVNKGDKLLEIDPSDLRKQLAAAETELATAQANLAKAQSDVQIGEAGDALAMKVQQTELSNAEAGLKWWEQVDGAHMLRSAELAVKQAKDNVEDQDDELEQLRKMYKSEELTNATADIVVKRALRALERAKIQQGMQEEKESKVKGHDYTVARQKLVFAIEQQRQQLAELTAKQQQQSALRQTALAGAQQAAEKAQTKVDELKADLEAFAVTAPFDGIAYAGELQQGRWQNANPKTLRPDEKLPAGQVVMTVVPAAKVRFVMDVPEAKLAFVESGAKVRVIPTAKPEAATEGTIGEPPPAGVFREREQFFPTPVTLAGASEQLAPGQRGTAQVAVEARGVLVVPASAVSKSRVKVGGADGTPHWRNVITGHADGEHVEVRSGLNEGDTILKEPAGK